VIFESEQVGEILKGRRTRTHRPVDASDPAYRVRVGRRGQSRSLSVPYQPKVGERIPVKTRPDASPSCHLTVVGFEQRRHGDLTVDDMRAAGYRTAAAYKKAWVRQHDRSWCGTAQVRVEVVAAAAHIDVDITPRHAHQLLQLDDEAAVTLLLGYPADMRAALLRELRGAAERDDDAQRVLPTLTPAMYVARFDKHWADKLIWVLWHELAKESAANLLAARPGSAHADYVSSSAQAMADEGEAVDRATIARLGEQAALRRKQGVVGDWLRMRRTLVEQINDLETSHELTEKQRKRLDRLRFQLESGDELFAA
jgi:hypothetical protein